MYVDGGFTHEKTSIAVDSKDIPHIAFGDSGLVYAFWDGDSWDVEWLESSGYADISISIAVDSSDYIHILYNWEEDYYYSTKHAFYDGVVWQLSGTGFYGDYLSLTFDSNDIPWASYEGYGLYFAYGDGHYWDTFYVDSGGYYSSIDMDENDWPHCSHANSQGLRYSRWNGSDWQNETVDPIGSSCQYTSLELDSNGLPHICYFDASTDALKYAWYDPEGGIDVVDLGADTTDEGLLINWRIEGDSPSSLRVLRTIGDEEPIFLHSEPLNGDATKYLDRGVSTGVEYCYWLEVTGADGTVERFGPTEAVSIPEQTTRLALGEPYPCPARDAVTLTYDLPNGCSGAVIEVYDLSGRRLDSIPLTDSGELTLEVSEYASGVYTARLSTDEGSVSRRLVITR